MYHMEEVTEAFPAIYNSVLMNYYHRPLVYQVSLLEEQPKPCYSHKHHSQVFIAGGCLLLLITTL